MALLVLIGMAAIAAAIYAVLASNRDAARRRDHAAWEAHQRQQAEAWRHRQAAQHAAQEAHRRHEAAQQQAQRLELERQEAARRAEAARQDALRREAEARVAAERFRQERAALQIKREKRAFEIGGPNGPTRLREERIEVGDTSEFVLLVLGEPHSRSEKATASTLIETWKWMDGRRIARQIRLKNGIVTTVDVRD